MSTPSLSAGQKPSPSAQLSVRIRRRKSVVYSNHSLFGAFERSSIMCDYSLYEFPNRLAREGEELVTYRFPLGSLGLVSPVELKNAHRKASVKRIRWTVRTLFERSSYPPADQP